jgi:signal transduction histidine kinase
VAAQSRATHLAREHAELTEDRARMQAAAAVTEERLRIAREMHDVVAHSISVMTLHVGGVRRLLRPDQDAERDALASAERAGRQAMEEMHRVLAVMRESPDAAVGPVPSLSRIEELLAPVRAAGLEVELELAGDLSGLPSGVDVAAYRIVQEALTNVLRHARASRVAVSLCREAGALRITVRDDGGAGTAVGSGTGRHPDGGHGLLGMQERASAYGGDVRAGGDPGGGFVVEALLPCDEDEVAAVEGAP